MTLTTTADPGPVALSDPARGLLRLLSFLAPGPVPTGLLGTEEAAPILVRAWALAGGLSSVVPAAETSWMPAAVNELLAASLAHGRPEEIAVAVETQERVRRDIPDGERRDWLRLALELVNILAPEDADDPTTWSRWRPVRPHVEAVLGWAEQEGLADSTGHLTGEKLGVYLFVSGDQAGAHQRLQRAFEIEVAHFGEDSPEAALAMSNLSFALQVSGLHEDAFLLRKRALEIFRLHPEGRAHQLVLAIGNLADSLREQGATDEAGRLFQEAVDTGVRLLGEAHRATALALYKWGSFLAAGADDRHAAEDLLRRALAADEQALGPDHPNVGRDLEALTGVLSNSAPPETLIPLCRRALSIARMWYPAASDAVAAPRENLADLLQRTGRDRDLRALRLDQREAEYREQLKTTPGDAQTWNELAMFLKNERADFAGAEHAYRKALEARPNDPDIHSNLAVLLASALDRSEEAEEHFRRALELNPGNASTLANFAFCVQNHRRDMEVAEGLYRMALEHAPRDANAHSNYASLLIITGRHDEAESHLAQAWAIQQEGGHDRTSARVLLQGALLRQLRGEAAGPWLGRLKVLFRTGMSHAPWAVGSLLDWLPVHLSSDDAARFREVIRAITDRAACQELEASPSWTALPEIPLEGPWQMITEV